MALALAGVGCSDDDGGDADDTQPPTSASTLPAAPDPEAFCDQLESVLGDDPLDGIFGHDDPMAAAAAFDGGKVTLDRLAALAPDDIASAAEGYRDVLGEWRELILPSTTVDAEQYQERADELRTRQAELHADFEAHLTAAC